MTVDTKTLAREAQDLDRELNDFERFLRRGSSPSAGDMPLMDEKSARQSNVIQDLVGIIRLSWHHKMA